MWQAGNIGVFADGDYTRALSNIKCKVLVMPARTDQYFPYVLLPSLRYVHAEAEFGTGRPEDSEVEVKHLEHGELAVIETVWGHIAGGGANAEDTKWMDGRIGKFLDASG